MNKGELTQYIVSLSNTIGDARHDNNKSDEEFTLLVTDALLKALTLGHDMNGDGK